MSTRGGVGGNDSQSEGGIEGTSGTDVGREEWNPEAGRFGRRAMSEIVCYKCTIYL